MLCPGHIQHHYCSCRSSFEPLPQLCTGLNHEFSCSATMELRQETLLKAFRPCPKTFPGKNEWQSC